MSSRDARDIPNPADHPDAVPFLKSIAASGGDPLPRLVFSDWLEEHGYHNAAAGQRWAAREGKRPAPGAARGWLWNHNHPQVAYNDIGRLHRMLPSAFVDNLHDPENEHFPHPVISRGGADPVVNEADFLDAMHRLSWHPETGDPIERQ